MGIVLLSMIFLHIVADFNLQGMLGELKQKKWWEEHYPDLYPDLYKNDYKVAAHLHAFSWAFMIMFPILVYQQFTVAWTFYGWFLLNLLAHYRIDDEKANRGSIGLGIDQFSHLVQIGITWWLFYKGYFM